MAMWMVRAESDGSLFEPFTQNNFVAIGWPKLGDIGQVASRDELIPMLQSNYPDRTNGAHQNHATMLFRFLKTLQLRDRVITYDRTSRVYAIGKLISEYQYQRGLSFDYPHVREVEWEETSISRDVLSATTKNSLGSTLTLFRLPESAEEEILRVLTGEQRDELGKEPIEEEQILLADVEVKSVEFIKDRISNLDWEELQSLVAGVLRTMGFKTRVSPRGPDQGKDIIASRDGFGFENPRIVVEVKHRKGQMGAPDVRSFIGGRHVEDKCLYVSTGGFTKEAKYEAERANVPVTLMDLDYLVETVTENYEEFDAETRKLVPLKRVYWPDS